MSRTTLPQGSEARKEIPLFSGPLRYFPAALAWVARVCKIGNDKHNPGRPLHHARGKSNDHLDCILRHLTDLAEDFGKGVGRDENGVPQLAYVAWRALAALQQWLEENEGAPLAPGAQELKTATEKLFGATSEDLSEAARLYAQVTAQMPLVYTRCPKCNSTVQLPHEC